MAIKFRLPWCVSKPQTLPQQVPSEKTPLVNDMQLLEEITERIYREHPIDEAIEITASILVGAADRRCALMHLSAKLHGFDAYVIAKSGAMSQPAGSA